MQVPGQGWNPDCLSQVHCTNHHASLAFKPYHKINHCFTGIEGAEINVAERNHPVRSAKDGDYWRLLRPGEYEVEVSKHGYTPVKRTIQVNEGPATRQEFILARNGQSLDEAGTDLEEVKMDDEKPVPVSLVIGLTIVCLVALMLALALAIMLAKKYRGREVAQGEYSQVHTEP